MDHGSHPQQQQQQQQTQQMPGPFQVFAGPQGPYPGQHPTLARLDELQKEVAMLGQQVWTFSGLQSDREYKRLERELTRLLLDVDQVRKCYDNTHKVGVHNIWAADILFTIIHQCHNLFPSLFLTHFFLFKLQIGLVSCISFLDLSVYISNNEICMLRL